MRDYIKSEPIYATRREAIRAAREFIGRRAKLGLAFNVYTVNGKWGWINHPHPWLVDCAPRPLIADCPC